MIDLKTASVLSRYEIPPSDAVDGLGFANIAVDVIDCVNNSLAYLPNLSASQILVYSLAKNTSYTVQHNYFHMNPFEGEYDVDGLKFSWDDAIFSIALGECDKDSPYRLAYFHPMSRFNLISRGFVHRFHLSFEINFSLHNTIELMNLSQPQEIDAFDGEFFL